MVKNPPCNARHSGSIPSWECPLRREWQLSPDRTGVTNTFTFQESLAMVDSSVGTDKMVD